MREVAVVVVPKLHVHRKPGSDPADILIYDLKQGDRFDVLERDSTRDRAEWIRKGKDEWVAEYNKVTGERFCKVTKVADRIDPEPKPRDPRLSTKPQPWWRGVPIGWWIVLCVVAAAFVWAFWPF